MLEVGVPGMLVEAVLAGRDVAALHREIQGEHARLQSEQMAEELLRR